VAPKYTPPGRIHCHRPTVNVFGYLTDDHHQHHPPQTGLGGSLAETFAVDVVNLATVWVWSVAFDGADAVDAAVAAEGYSTLSRDTATAAAVGDGAVRLATMRMRVAVVHLVVLVMMAFVVDMTLALTVLPAWNKRKRKKTSGKRYNIKIDALARSLS
jgi:hypothetical protein